MSTSVVLPEGVTPVDNGYRIRETDEYVVDIWRYSFNWRLVSYLARQQFTTERGYCFLGLGAVPLERAIAAGLAWEDPLHSDPPDYDKRAFPDPQWAEHLRGRMQ